MAMGEKLAAAQVECDRAAIIKQLEEVVEHQRIQIENLKMSLKMSQQGRDAERKRVEEVELHLDKVRADIGLVLTLIDPEKAKAFQALERLRAEADKDCWELETD